MGKKLTPTQKAFVNAFCADPSNQAKAYQQASPSSSPSQAKNQAWKYLNDPRFGHVQDEIKRREEKAEKDAEISRGRLMQETAYIALSDPGGIFDENGSMIQPNELPQEVRRALKSIEVNTRTDQQGNIYTTYKYHFWDKVRCLELYSKFKGWHSTNVNVGNKNGKAFKTDQTHHLAEGDPVASLIDDMLGTSDEQNEDHEEPEAEA